MSAMRWQGLGQLASQAAWYVMFLVLAALLPPRAFGTVATGVTIVAVANLLATSGTGGTLVVSRGLTRADVLRVARTNLQLGVTLAAVIAVLAGPLVDLFARGGSVAAVRVLAVNVALASLAVVPNALLQRSLDFRRYSRNTMLAAFTTAGAAIAAAAAGAGVWALVVRQVLYLALLAALGWWAVRPALASLEHSSGGDAGVARPRRQLPFLVVTVSMFLGLSADNIAVGHATGAAQLGYYALAFGLAFAPLTQFAWQVGGVLMPAAAATEDRELLANRTVQALRVVSMVLFPLVPPAVALAPVLVPAVLGHRWDPMVPVFQILVVVGVGQALTSTLSEFLSGAGHIAARARVELPWAIATLVAIYLLARAAGIEGAAVGRAAAFLPLAVWYATAGARRVGVTPARLWAGLRAILVSVLAESLLVASASLGLASAGAPAAIAAGVASVAGLATTITMLALSPSKPLAQGARVVRLAMAR